MMTIFPNAWHKNQKEIKLFTTKNKTKQNNQETKFVKIKFWKKQHRNMMKKIYCFFIKHTRFFF